MTSLTKDRIKFRPRVGDALLEDRLVLSTTGTAEVAPVTPPPAPSPLSSTISIGNPTQWKTPAQLRRAYTRDLKLATVQLRSAVGADIQSAYANGADPTAQQLADLKANISGALDATALEISSQAALLPRSSSRLVPAIQNAILGSGPRSVASVLGSDLQSGQATASAARLSSAVARAIVALPQQITPQLSNYFANTNLVQASVNSSGQQIPLSQYMGQQVISQLGNTLGSLAQSLPNVANSVLYPTGTTTTPTQAEINAFGTQATNALETAAFQLGSDLSLFNGSSNLVSQLDPILLGLTNTGTGTSTGTNSLASLEAGLQSLPYGSTGLDSALSTLFNGSYNNMANAIDSYLGMGSTEQSTSLSALSIPTSGIINPFSSQFTTTAFDDGFNNGFATGTNTGFVGFGLSPTSFNTNFGTGFNNLVSTLAQTYGFSANTAPNFSLGGSGDLSGTLSGATGSSSILSGSLVGTTGTLTNTSGILSGTTNTSNGSGTTGNSTGTTGNTTVTLFP